jgi:hypothetical protein
MKLDEITVYMLGFREMEPVYHGRKSFVLERPNFIILLDYSFLLKGTADAWFLEGVEVETVADLLQVCYELGSKNSTCPSTSPDGTPKAASGSS